MFFVWAVVIVALQMTVLKGANLLVVLAVFAGLRKGATLGLAIGAAIGMFAGFSSGAGLGLNAGLYAMVGLLSGIAKAHIFYKEDIFMEVIFSFCGVMLFYGVYFILTKENYVPVLSTALFSAALSPILFRVVEK